MILVGWVWRWRGGGRRRKWVRLDRCFTKRKEAEETAWALVRLVQHYGLEVLIDEIMNRLALSLSTPPKSSKVFYATSWILPWPAHLTKVTTVTLPIQWVRLRLYIVLATTMLPRGKRRTANRTGHVELCS